MAQSSGKIYIPPFSGVRLIECRDHIQLVPVPAVRVFCGYGKMKASDFAHETDEGAPPFADFCEPDEEIWVIVEWYRFEDGHEERGSTCYLRSPATEEDARKAMREMEGFRNQTRQELLDLTQCYEATEDDFKYIDDNYPNYQSPPSDPHATDEYDVYHARLKVLAGLQPKTVELIKIADATQDPVKRQKVEREAVQSYFAELAHYWTEEEILAWQRSNPVGTGWLCEFGSVMHEPRKTIDPVNHELALNWLRRSYNLMTAEALSHSIFKKILIWLTPAALKKRRERLGLTTRRPPGPPPKQP